MAEGKPSSVLNTALKSVKKVVQTIFDFGIALIFNALHYVFVLVAQMCKEYLCTHYLASICL